jgi:PAS domain S-box-containing protein
MNTMPDDVKVCSHEGLLIKLRESEERLRLATEAAELGLHDYNLITGEITWDKVVREIWGVGERKKITYEVFLEGLHKEDLALTQEAFDNALNPKGNGLFKAHYRVINIKNLRQRWVAATGKVTFENSKPVRLVGTVQDITAQKQTEESLKISEEFTRRLAEIAPSILYIYDIDEKKNVWGNREMFELLGYSREDLDNLSGGLLANLLHPEDIISYNIHAAKFYSLKDQEVIEFEYRLKRSDGSWKRLLSRDMVFSRNSDGSPKQIIGAAQDMTAQRLAQDQIEESQQLLSSVFQGIDGAITVCDVLNDGKSFVYVAVNKTCEEWSGISDEKWQNHSPYTIFDLLRAEHISSQYLKAYTLKKSITYEQHHFFSNGPVWVITTVSPILDNNGKINRLVSTSIDITQRKNVENALRNRESQLYLALRASLSVVFQWDIQKNRITRIQGSEPYCPDAVIQGETLEAMLEKVYIEDRALFLKNIENALNTANEKYRSEFRIAAPDGEVRWLSEYGYVEFDEKGKPLKLTGISRDVSAEKFAEQRIDITQEAAHAGFFQWDIATHKLKVTGFLKRLSGADPIKGEIALKDWVKVVNVQDAQRIKNEFTDVFKARLGEHTYEFRIRTDTGERWLHGYARIEYNETGYPRRVYGIDYDITERKEAEAALQRSEEALIERERELQSLADNSPNIIARFDRNLRYVFVNKSIVRATNKFPLELIGKSNRDLRMPEVLSNQWESALEKVFQDGLSHEINFSTTDSNGERWYESQLVPEFDDSGEVSYVLTVTREITEAYQSAQSLARAKEEADSANEAKDRFLAALSHELRTPLSPVKMQIALWSRRQDLPEWIRPGLEIIHRNINLEARLIDDMLDLNRIARGKIELQFKDLDLHKELLHSIKTVETDALAKKISLTYDFKADFSSVKADATRFQQVIWNLLKNAIKFTPSGGAVRVMTQNSDDMERIKIIVQDTGIGIDPTLLPYVFNAFEQGGPEVTRQFGGLGLGLAISKAIIELHRGIISAESKGKGQGVTFTIDLKVEKPLTKEFQHPATIENETGKSQFIKNPIRILLVEDHEDTATLMTNLLEALGHSVHTVSTVMTALKAVKSEIFDLIISDLGLPDGHGNEIVRKLNVSKRPVAIALSGFGMEEDLRRSRESGFDAHLIKPVNIEQLEVTIQKLFGRGLKNLKNVV